MQNCHKNVYCDLAWIFEYDEKQSKIYCSIYQKSSPDLIALLLHIHDRDTMRCMLESNILESNISCAFSKSTCAHHFEKSKEKCETIVSCV